MVQNLSKSQVIFKVILEVLLDTCVTFHTVTLKISQKHKSSFYLRLFFHQKKKVFNQKLSLNRASPGGKECLSLASGCVCVPCSLTERFRSDSVIDFASGFSTSGSAQALMKCGFPLQLMSQSTPGRLRRNEEDLGGKKQTIAWACKGRNAHVERARLGALLESLKMEERDGTFCQER